MSDINLFDFSLIDFVDVFLVAILLFYIYKLVRGTVAINIFIGILVIYLVWVVTDYLNMHLLYRIVDGFMKVGIIALIVVFQPEIRKFLLMVGSTNLSGKRRIFKNFKFLNSDTETTNDIETIVNACIKMGTTNTGALIVIERNNSLDFLTNTGDKMNITVSQPILESIFFKNSPLHDGAAIIENNVVKATRVILPVNNDANIPKRFGLRHRAALGITEKTDALALIVSEETGTISYVKNAEFVMYKTKEELVDKINKDLI